MSECAGDTCTEPGCLGNRHDWRKIRIKTDGKGEWMAAGDTRLGNRAARRKLARESRARGTGR